ncbi:unnamed protein product [Microthlaspi erraticum]|uniref:Protein OSB3, chloroplastic/mitochondrial n=1 Tax=Microthlaspi erraticum TaxID=1685480 RepID=A0A6D2HG70_9BRAS|nr:unnamed protein product [Microthlaspi erraticum]
MILISRKLTRVVCSSLYHSRAAKLPTQKWVISQQICLYSAKASVKPPDVAEEIELARPKTIDNDGETANWVNLTGFVDQPVQFQSSSEGIWAGTIISQRSTSKSSNFWIPIIFEGNLAKIAAHHVKKDDRIRVSGRLFIDSPPQNVTYPHSSVQIVVQDLNFEQATISLPEEEAEISTENQPSRSKKVEVMDEATISLPDEEEITIVNLPSRSKKGKATDEETSNAWKNLLENPKGWLDYRGTKASGLVKPKHPDFKGTNGGLSLWLCSAPDWVLPKLNGLEFHGLVPKGKLKQLKGEESWKDLVQNTDKWFDNRSTKTNPKAPDFKHKETGEALWMTDSPPWVLSKLPPPTKNQEQPLMATTVSQSISKPHKDEEFWKDLVQNPGKWWDNRLKKINAKSPDFKHKETGQALWLNGSPPWVLSKLPPLKNNEEGPIIVNMPNSVSQPISKPHKNEEFWMDLVQNPSKWWDNRANKTNPKAPDFKHKETGEVLWMTGSPSWVQSELLPPLKNHQEQPFMAKTVSQPILKPLKKEESWKDLVENPDKWWDNRSKKMNAKCPDFKHKDTGEALWLNGSPPWVLSKLPPPKTSQERPAMAYVLQPF